jgi:hypothetical protein
MNYINLGYGYRLHRRDSRNWELQRFREIKQNNNPKARIGVSEWSGCGKFYQSLRAALLAVYELVLHEDDGKAVDLEEALKRAEEIEKSLKAVSVNLLNLK